MNNLTKQRLAHDRPMLIGGAGWKARRQASVERREAYLADASDPHKIAIRRVRAACAAVADIRAEAGRRFALENDPVAVAALGIRAIHPQKAAVLAEFLRGQGWSGNPLDPICPVLSIGQIAAELGLEAQAEMAEANRALRDIEGVVDLGTKPSAPIQTPEPATMAQERRGRGRPPRELAAQLQAEGIDTDE